MPFSVEQFIEIFSNYNQNVWPMQVVFYLMAMYAIFSVVRSIPASDRLVSGILAFFWLWMGMVYHWLFFSSINKAAWLFGGLFVAQAVFFAQRGIFQQKQAFRFKPDLYGLSGAVLMGFSLVVYPLLGMTFGHHYPSSPTFGLPCPTTIFTLGLLLWSVQKPPLYLAFIPVVWSLIGFTAALKLGIVEDSALLLAGGLTVILMVRWNRKNPVVQSPAV